MALVLNIAVFWMLANSVALTSGNNAANGDPSRAQWTDPNDMINFDPSADEPTTQADSGSATTQDLELRFAQRQLGVCQQMLKNTQELHMKELAAASDKLSPEAILMQHFLRKLMESFDADADRIKDTQLYSVMLRITRTQAAAWTKFATAKRLETGDWREVISALMRVLQSMTVAESRRHNTVLKAASDLLRPWLPIVNVLAVVMFFTMFVVQLVRIRPVLVCSWLFLFCFVVSFLWTWFYLYQVKQAELLSRMFTLDQASACKPQTVNGFASFVNRVKTILGYETDTCRQYFKDVTIDPMWQVKPLQILSLTITEFLFEPAELCGRHLGRFFHALMSETSFFMKPFIWIPAIFLIVSLYSMFMIFVCGYRISWGFGLFNVEPARTAGPPRLRQASPGPKAMSSANATLPAVTAVENIQRKKHVD